MSLATAHLTSFATISSVPADGYPFITELASALLAYNIRQYTSFVGLAIFYHTWLLSLPREVSYVWFLPGWREKGLYLLTRYGALVYLTSPVLYSLKLIPNVSCTGTYNFNVYVGLATQFGMYGLILVVIYPLVKKREWWLGAIILMGAIQVILQWFMFKLTTCHIVNILAIGPVLQRQANLKVFIEISKMLFEGVTFGAVLTYTWPIYLETIDYDEQETKLVRFMTKSGALRSFVIWVCTITTGIMWKTLSPQLLGVTDQIRSAIGVTLICDWYLNFQEIMAQLKAPESMESEYNFTTHPETLLSFQNSTCTWSETVSQTSQAPQDDYPAQSQISSRRNWDFESEVISYAERGDGSWVTDRHNKKIRKLKWLRS